MIEIYFDAVQLHAISMLTSGGEASDVTGSVYVSWSPSAECPTLFATNHHCVGALAIPQVGYPRPKENISVGISQDTTKLMGKRGGLCLEIKDGEVTLVAMQSGVRAPIAGGINSSPLPWQRFFPSPELLKKQEVANYLPEVFDPLRKCAHALMGRRSKTAMRLFQRGDSAGVVQFDGLEHFMGLVMPCRYGFTNAPYSDAYSVAIEWDYAGSAEGRVAA